MANHGEKPTGEPLSAAVARPIELISRIARESGLRAAIRRSPAAERLWSLTRALFEPLQPPAPPPPQPAPPQPAPPPPVPPPPVVERRFRELLAERYGVADIDAERDPLKRMYLDFALSTVWRGGQTAQLLGAQAPLAGKRYLDVGCAYGGFLVAFLRSGVREAVGFDINPKLLDYSRALLADHELAAEVYEHDVLQPSTRERFGQFDVITCNDVIEHVNDPRVALHRLVSLLAPGGLLFLEIPNRCSAAFVLSDGHFQHFGITPLPKFQADAYFDELHPGEKHDVTYKALPFYLNTLRGLGVHVELAPPKGDLPERLARAAAVFDECENVLTRPLPVSEARRRQLARATRRVVRVFRRQHGRYRALLKTDSAAAAALGERLALTFCEDFWTVTARAPA